MVNEFCPKCNTLTSMTLTTTESNNEKTEDGKSFKVETTSYFCNVCHVFIRSEDKKIVLNQEVQ